VGFAADVASGVDAGAALDVGAAGFSAGAADCAGCGVPPEQDASRMDASPGTRIFLIITLPPVVDSLLKGSCHSERNAMSGSTRDARRAGM